MKTVEGYWSSYIVHALKDGTFKSLWLSDRIKSKIVDQDIYVKTGDSVRRFFGSNDTIGTMIIKYDNMNEMQSMIANMQNDIRVIFE